MKVRADDDEIRGVQPLIKRAPEHTLYGVPAVVVYLLLVPLGIWLFNDVWTAGRIFFAISACIHALIFLSCRWSVRIRCQVEFQEVRPRRARQWRASDPGLTRPPPRPPTSRSQAMC